MARLIADETCLTQYSSQLFSRMYQVIRPLEPYVKILCLEKDIPYSQPKSKGKQRQILPSGSKDYRKVESFFAGRKPFTPLCSPTSCLFLRNDNGAFLLTLKGFLVGYVIGRGTGFNPMDFSTYFHDFTEC
jgi:hypothetical protein